jgi:septal ring factor EnvC (AmiA/AmiB activator)
MLAAALALLLAADPVVDPERAELDRVAVRIERLKERQRSGDEVGAELERMLLRAEELAQRIERRRRGETPRGAPQVGPDPQELRERADALRDERDRVAVRMKDLDEQIAAVRRERRVEAGLESLAQESSLFGDQGAGRASPRTGTGGGKDPPPVDPTAPASTFGPRTEGAVTEGPRRITALQRLDRLRAERAALAARHAELDAEATALDAQARALADLR